MEIKQPMLSLEEENGMLTIAGMHDEGDEETPSNVVQPPNTSTQLLLGIEKTNTTVKQLTTRNG